MKTPTLGNPQNTIEILQKYNFNFQKKFGQNFLIDEHVLDRSFVQPRSQRMITYWRSVPESGR